MNLGESIRFHRKENKLSAKQLGEKLGISAQAILQYERGERTPNIDIIKQIACALDVPLFILTNEEDMESLITKYNSGTIPKSFATLVNSVLKTSNSEEQYLSYPTGNFKIELCKKLLYELGYSVEIIEPIVKINNNSRIIKTIEVKSYDFIKLADNIHWALESFIESFISEGERPYKDDMLINSLENKEVNNNGK